MGTLILIVLLLAALTGVFWQVLKITAIAILSLILTIAVLIAGGIWYAKRRWRRFMSDPEIQQRIRAAQGHPRPGAVPAEGRKEPDEPLPG